MTEISETDSVEEDEAAVPQPESRMGRPTRAVTAAASGRFFLIADFIVCSLVLLGFEYRRCVSTTFEKET
jgi:hypothetical protein